MYDKYKSYYLDGVEIKPTFKLQMQSLETFAAWIGYEMCPKTCQFELMWKYDTSSRQVVDFNTMVRLHNTSFTTEGCIYKKDLKDVSEKLGFCLLRMQHAIDGKLVKAVHLQRKKSKKIRGENYTLPEIVLTSHIIKFA